MSYSQQDEERHILESVSQMSGRFLDIGAFHPRVMSNTRALFERGWSGVMVEPSPRPMLDLLAEYGNEARIILISGVVGIERRMATLHVTDDAVSTVSEEQFQRWNGTAQYRGSFRAPQITLRKLFEEFGAFDFIDIDAEGISTDLFIQALDLGQRPECICVEHDGRMPVLTRRAAAAGYRLIHANDTNAIYGL